MNRILLEKEIMHKSAVVAEKYINEKFKTTNIVDRHLAVNGVAHGYYMGVKHSKTLKGEVISQPDLETTSINAAKFYIKKKFPQIATEERTLLSNTVAHGFREGVRANERGDVSGSQAEPTV